MKKADEIFGDTPWWADYDDFEDCWKVYCTRKGFPDGAVTLDGEYDEATAKAIASLPELYKALYDDVTFYCEHCLDTHGSTECPQKDGGDCKILEWRKLLEKAGGVE